MKKLLLIILIVLLLFASCSKAQLAEQEDTTVPAPTEDEKPSPNPTPIPEPTPPPEPTPEPTPTPKVKLSDPESALSVRQGPGTNTEKLGTLKQGDTVTILEQGDVWHKIEYKGNAAYVFAAYITNVPISYATVPALEATVKGKTYVSNMVDVRTIIPDIKIWLTFASQDNVMGKVLYPAGACLLQQGTAEKLLAASKIFAKDGYRIRLYDGYRPYSVSEYLYDEIRDGRFVAHVKPSKPSNHNRGAAVDITLERIDTGEQIPMPSLMHTFNISSLRKYPNISQYEQGSPEYIEMLDKYPDIFEYPKRSDTSVRNMNYITSVMKDCGFSTITTEWWHFNDKDKDDYMVLDYDLASDVVWIAAEDYEEYLKVKENTPPLTDLPDYVVYPEVEKQEPKEEPEEPDDTPEE